MTLGPLRKLIFSVILFLLPVVARAYPEFIGYGYTSCVTCHYNTQGNGPLNDYGRALFAGEIAARDIFDDATTDDELGQDSGFLGKKPLPWWLRPALKYRNLWVDTNPGSTSNNKQYYLMQEDADVTIYLDHDQKYIVTGDLSYLSRTNGLGQGTDAVTSKSTQVWLSRESYFRWNPFKELFVTVGMIDKVFGIRTADHTQFNRQGPGIDQYDNTIGTLTHGAMIQWNTPEHEFTLNPFIGNFNDDSSVRAKGATFMAEFTTGEKSRTGGAVLYQNTPTVAEQAIEVHEKYGLTLGSSLLAEAGYYVTNDSSSTGTNTNGYYVVAESMVLLRRGYNFVSDMEYLKTATANKGDGPDNWRWGLGLLMFPLPRVEFRFTAQDGRTWQSSQGNKDSWNILGQFHLSL